MYVASNYILDCLNRNQRIEWKGTWKRRCSIIASTASTEDKVIAPFDSCKSPITVDVVFGAEKRLDCLLCDHNLLSESGIIFSIDIFFDFSIPLLFSFMIHVVLEYWVFLIDFFFYFFPLILCMRNVMY